MTNWRRHRAPDRQRALKLLHLLASYLIFCGVTIPHYSASCNLACGKRTQTERSGNGTATSLSSSSTGESHVVSPDSDPHVRTTFLSPSEEGTTSDKVEEELQKDEARRGNVDTKEANADGNSHNSACLLLGANAPPCCKSSSCGDTSDARPTNQQPSRSTNDAPRASSETPSIALPASHRSLAAVEFSSPVLQKKPNEIAKTANNDTVEKSTGKGEPLIGSRSHSDKQNRGTDRPDRVQTSETTSRHPVSSGGDVSSETYGETSPILAKSVRQQSNVESAAHEKRTGKQGNERPSSFAVTEKADNALNENDNGASTPPVEPEEELRSSEKRFMQVALPAIEEKEKLVSFESSAKTESRSWKGREQDQLPKSETNARPASTSFKGGFPMPLWVLAASVVGFVVVTAVGLLAVFVCLRSHRLRQRKKHDAILMLRKMVRSNSIPTPELVSRYAREMREEDDTGERRCSVSQSGGTAPLPLSDNDPTAPKKRDGTSRTVLGKGMKLPFRNRRKMPYVEQGGQSSEAVERTVSTSSSISQSRPEADVPEESLPGASEPRLMSGGVGPSGWKKVGDSLRFFSLASMEATAQIPLSPAGVLDVREVRNEFAATPSPQEAKRCRNKWVVVARHQQSFQPPQNLGNLRVRDEACDRLTWASEVAEDVDCGAGGLEDPAEVWSSDIPSHMMQTAIQRETDVIDEDAIVEFDATVPLENTDESEGGEEEGNTHQETTAQR